ncbi:MAG: RsmB/NOP family class I SAM-dependent RNA methyltransferase [archaeon]
METPDLAQVINNKQYSLPRNRSPQLKPLFTERMQELLPDKEDYQKYLEILKVPPVKSIRCNKLKISPTELKNKLEKKNWKISQPWKNYPEVMIVKGKTQSKETNNKKTQLNSKLQQTSNSSLTTPNQSREDLKSSLTAIREGGRGMVADIKSPSQNLIDLEPGELGRSLEHLLGYYYIQELASMLPIIALNPKQDEMILDLCSAPGSKTTQTASEMENTGTIIANEVSMGRLKILASNLERCGVTNTIITKKEGIALCKKLKRENFQFDRILVDAPCSGEGTLRSSPKTYLMWNPKTIKALSRLQKTLVSSALEILKPNGTLIYSTCTHAPEENEEIVDFILQKFKNKIELELLRLPIKPRQGIKTWQDNTYSKEVKKCARIYPHDNNTEGFFIAKFKKTK